ncbi:Cof-type HAD-IIB family hydrolase [Bacillus rubiinfantis]|uniref:Cof-type HAD-IIB family hydrolase n=1 Tax=Bacillus rubiinfantis TaxID=1499680 RepID=UPI0005AA7B74|nr:Cof-type HAD-IIB family hydrolase [Bacillus rubiinfantis]
MIRCIATDMDGTLLNSMQEITEENRQAIIKAQQQGVEVVVATGRSYQEAVYVLDAAGLQCPVICVNGAEVRSQDGEVLSANPIPNALARETAASLSASDIYFEVYTNRGAYTIDADKAVSTLVDIVMSANPEADREEIIVAAGARIRDGLIEVVDSYEQLFTNEEVLIYKFLAFSFEDDGKLEGASASLASFSELEVTKSGVENIEITHKNAQKGIALEAFTSSRGIALANTMAIGDNFNDISMLEKAGRAVAMGNASFEIKAMCDVITETNEESGVGKAILEVL